MAHAPGTAGHGIPVPPASLFFEDAGVERGCDDDPALSGNLVGGR